MAGNYVSAAGLKPTPENPFTPNMVRGGEIVRPRSVKGKKGWATRSSNLVDPETGELLEDTVCLAHKKELKDRGQFIKVYVDGLKGVFGLSARARKAFTTLMECYTGDPVGPMQRNDMLVFNLDMANEAGWNASLDVFKSAMNELCHKEFLCPVVGASNWFWTNPTFFHRGDRLVIVNHYVLREADASISAKACGDTRLDQEDLNGETERDRQNGRGPVGEEDAAY